MSLEIEIHQKEFRNEYHKAIINILHTYSFLVSKRERMLDKMSDASRIVERLRLKEFVVRQGALQDKRTVEVSITEKGLQLLSRMEAEVNSLEALFFHIDPKEIHQMNNVLDKIRVGKSQSTKEKLVV